MAAEAVDRVSSIIDVDAVKVEFEQIDAMFESSKALIIDMASTMKAYQAATGGTALKTATNDLVAGNEKLLSVQKLLNQETVLQNIQTAERNRQLKLQAQLENSVAGSQEFMKNKIKDLNNQLQILNVTTEAGRRKEAEIIQQREKYNVQLNETIARQKELASTKSAPNTQTREEYVASVPFTSNLEQLKAEAEQAEVTGTVVNELDIAQAEAANSATVWGEAIAVQAAAEGNLNVVMQETVVTEAEKIQMSKEAAIASKIEADATASAGNDYKQLTLAYKDAVAKAQQYALTLGDTHPLTLQAAADAQALQTRITEVNDITGKGSANAKTFGDTVAAAFNRVSDPGRIVGRVFTSLSRQMIMLGTGMLSFVIGAKALELLAGELEELYKYLTRDSDAIALMKLQIQDWNDVNSESHKKAGEQLTDLKVLTETAKDNTVSMKDRLAATQQLKSEFPDYFSQLENEKILNGDIKQSYDDLTESILKTSIATAARGKLAELESQRLDVEFTKQKTNNVYDNRQARNKSGADIADDNKAYAKDFIKQDAIYIEQDRQEALKPLDKLEADIKAREDFLLKFAGDDNISKSIEGKTTDLGVNKKSVDLEDELLKIALQKQIDYYSDIAKNEKLGMDDRIAAMQLEYKKRQDLLTVSLAEELKLNTEAQAETNNKISKSKSGSSGYENAQIELGNEIAQRTILEAKYQADRVKLERDGDEAIKVLREKALKEQEDYAKTALEQDSKIYKEDADDNSKSLADRLTAYKNYIYAQQALINLKHEQDIRLAGSDATKKAQAELDFTDANTNLGNTSTKDVSSIVSGDFTKNKDDAFQSIETKHLTDEADATFKLNAQFDAGRITAKKYAEELAKIKDALDISELKLKIKSLNDELLKVQGNTDLTSGDKDKQVKDLQNQIASLNEQLAGKGGPNKKTGKLSVDDEIKIAQDTQDGIFEIISARYQKENDLIEKQMQLVEDRKNKEIDAINSSTENQQTKALQIALAEKRAADQKAQLEAKERANKLAEAKFDKAASLLKIAEGIGVDIADGNWVAAAAGAIQLGVIGAKPLPTYYTGTESAPRSEFAMTDELGPELYIGKDGKMTLGSNTPNVKYIERGTKIIKHDEVADYLLSSVVGNATGVGPSNAALESKMDELIRVSSNSGKAQVKAIKQSRPIITVKTDGKFNDYINNSI